MPSMKAQQRHRAHIMTDKVTFVTVSRDEDLFVEERLVDVDGAEFDVIRRGFSVITVLHDALLHFLPIQRSVDVRRVVRRHLHVGQSEGERTNDRFE